MKFLIAVVFAISLYAQEETLVPEQVEKTLSLDEEILEYEEQAVEENEISTILDKDKLEVQSETSSLHKVIEKETGQILQTQKYEEESFEEKKPKIEDLAKLVESPPVTLSESPQEKPNFYETLAITMEEKEKIGIILMTMAENNVFQLIFEKKYLERLGHDINHVHPIRFIGTVFNDPRLVRCLRQIRKNSFKWNGFIDGFSERLKEEIRAGNVNDYVPGLAESLNVKEEDVQFYINGHNLEGLVIFLLDRNRK